MYTQLTVIAEFQHCLKIIMCLNLLSPMGYVNYQRFVLLLRTWHILLMYGSPRDKVVGGLSVVYKAQEF